MVAPTVVDVGENLAANGGPGSLGDFRVQVFHVTPDDATDTDLSLTGVELSHVCWFTWCVMDTTNTAAADAEHVWLDQAVDATKKCVVVASNALTFTRVATGDGTLGLVDKDYIITLYGY